MVVAMSLNSAGADAHHRARRFLLGRWFGVVTAGIVTADVVAVVTGLGGREVLR
jgi:hypothetical protein